MDELVQRLSTGSHPVTIGGQQQTPEELRRRVEEIGIIFIEFTETRGGTDLGLNADRGACDLSGADFENGTGTVHLEGTLILNDEPIRCLADIDLATMHGTGRLVVESVVAG
jgi:hypothetical protein